MPTTVPKSKIVECAAARGLDLAFVSVLISGSITNAVLPTTFGVKAGDKVQMSFKMLPAPMDRIANDGSGVHMQDGIGAYPICNETFSLTVGDSTLKAAMGPALPATEFVPLSTDTFLSIASKRPVNDAIFLSTSATTPASLPLKMSGVQDLYTPQWNLDFKADYARGTFPSLHMKGVAKQAYGSKKGMLKQYFALSTGFATNNVVEAIVDSIEFDVPKAVA